MRSVHLKGYFRKIRRKGSVLVKGGVKIAIALFKIKKKKASAAFGVGYYPTTVGTYNKICSKGLIFSVFGLIFIKLILNEINFN